MKRRTLLKAGLQAGLAGMILPGRKGDSITIFWLDNRGNSDTATAKVR